MFLGSDPFAVFPLVMCQFLVVLPVKSVLAAISRFVVDDFGIQQRNDVICHPKCHLLRFEVKGSWNPSGWIPHSILGSEVCSKIKGWLVVSTHLKNISQNGNLPQVGVKIKKMKPPPRR